MKNVISIDVGNYYNKPAKDKLVEELKKGNAVSIYVNCSGHQRAEMVESHFVSELKKEVDLKEGRGNFGSKVYYI